MLSEAFAIQLSRDDMVSSISEVPWLLVGVWIWRRWFWNLRFDYWRCFRHLRCSWSPLITSCEYVRYFGIVRTMPTYSIRHLGMWSGSLIFQRCKDNAYAECSTSGHLIWKSDTPALRRQCLRIVVNLWVFDLEVCFVTFVFVTYCWRLVIVVSELL